MPQQWWIMLRPAAPFGRPLRSTDLKGVIDKIWPTSDPAHKEQKPYVMHGWPEPRGSDLAWSWSWLPHDREPPTTLTDQIGQLWPLGQDNPTRVVAAVAGPPTPWEQLLEPTWYRPGWSTFDITAKSPVVRSRTIGRRRHYDTTLDPHRLFGKVPTSPSAIRTTGREFGLFSAAHKFAPPHVTAQLITAAHLTTPTLTLTKGADWQETPTLQPHQAQPGRGWQGTVHAHINHPDPTTRAAMAALLNTAQLTGIGLGTAYGHGSITTQCHISSHRTRTLREPTSATEPADLADLFYEQT